MLSESDAHDIRVQLAIQAGELEGLGGVRINEERLVVDSNRVVGRGGYGTVYLGDLLDPSTGKVVKVAVKQLRSDETQDLRVALVRSSTQYGRNNKLI